MTYLKIRASDDTREQLERFKKIIAGYHIVIVDCWENEISGTIEITTNAEDEADISSVKAAAYDCFEDSVVSFRSTGKYSVLRQKK